MPSASKATDPETPAMTVPPTPDLWLFFLLVAGVIALPGMDMAYVAGNALVGGLRAGAAAVAGIMAGGLVHVAVAMTGIATLLAVWPAAFDALLVAGALYMAWIGWQIVRSTSTSTPGAADVPAVASPSPAAPARTPARVFRGAAFTCLVNPKAYAFSLAVFPAFVHAGGRPLVLQASLLAAIVVSTQAAIYGAVALAAAGTGRAAGASASTTRRLARVVGPLLIVGAVATLVLGWRPAQAKSPDQPHDKEHAMTASRPIDPHAAPDPAHDFDFLIGDWHIENRKRLGILKNDERWETFAAESHARVLAAGIGNRDDFVAPAWRPDYVGMTIRLYNPQTRLWSLFWNTNGGGGLDPKTGHLLPPVVGGFQGDTGRFEGDDTWEGRPIRVRYTWRRIDATHATWAQAFSADGGRSWETNWEMALARRDAADDVLALERLLADAYRHADVAMLARHLDDRFTRVDAAGEQRTKADEIGALRDGRLRYTRFETREPQLRMIGPDVAVVGGTGSIAGRLGERAFDEQVRVTDTFVREEGGRWRLAAAQASGPLARP
jgi:threonine/homoserine/homoserine lactone efflux protein/ketosteroid isomerase-like protein